LAINEANSKYYVKNSLKPIISLTASSLALGQIAGVTKIMALLILE
jgi:hypothetical protein